MAYEPFVPLLRVARTRYQNPCPAVGVAASVARRSVPLFSRQPVTDWVKLPCVRRVARLPFTRS